MKKSYRQPCVLMYHGIVTEWTALPEDRETGADLYDVSLNNFQDQMQWLSSNGYEAVILDDRGASLNKKEVILTFDDGEMNNYEQAFPILKKFEFPAYFFIISKRVGLKGYLGWDELRELYQAGMVIGSHGFSHEILTNLLDTQIEEELRASKRYLERNLDIEVNTLSIPRGFCDDHIIQKAYEVGYKRVFISERPRQLESDCYSRLAIKSHWILKRFKQAVEGHIPFQEKVIATTKSAIKRVFGGGVYDWVRRTILKLK